ncbi:proenkephalin-A [Sorex fumeus]|uniref:proenkephalin-A n=1 Tax=Sorex fumeus TaxID=62283 RepID=UPI0024AE685D|nr:proenkephalin-A [Sorex fumeus]
MARFLTLCTWLVALGPGLLATVTADCVQDCAACVLLARPADLSAETCTLECEGKLSSLNTWGICKELLHPSKLDLPGESSREAIKWDDEDWKALMKRYGGFMKRYGGFMKKMDELYETEPEEAKRYGGFMKKDAEEEDGLKELVGMEPPREVNIHQYSREDEPHKRYGGFMKKDEEEEDVLKELVGTEAPREVNIHQYSREDEPSKRYGGFMRGTKRTPEMEDEARELQKRYGGFMRRVGRPEWWTPYKRYGGFLKRFADFPPDKEWYPKIDKRYGGFMKP